MAGALASLSLCVAALLSPAIVAWCRRKSTRLTAVLGGLLAALGLLFTSFASQFHQLFVSYGIVLGRSSSFSPFLPSLSFLLSFFLILVLAPFPCSSSSNSSRYSSSFSCSSSPLPMERLVWGNDPPKIGNHRSTGQGFLFF